MTAYVTIDNQGFAGSPLDDNEQSVVGVRAVFIADDGSERVVAAEMVPELQPGESKQVKLPLEMPHDPVRVRVELDPNPVDRDATNNSSACLFGAPAPKDVVCELDVAEDEAATPVVNLSWTNAGIYDEVIIYRDGSMLASLPGACTRFVDLYSPEGPVEYSVRGRTGASKSARATVPCGFVEPPRPVFVRADADGDGRINITDGIFALVYHFLGGPDPRPPHPACGTDPTEDLLECETQAACR